MNGPPARSDGKRAVALAWAARGLRVFPLRENCKLPNDAMSWTLHASSDPNIVHKMWSDPWLGTERDYNIGFLTDDHIVIDIDVKDRKQGLKTALEDLELYKSTLYPSRIPDFNTLTVRTPSGGYHAVYQGVDHLVGSSHLVSAKDGIDVKSFHGYVAAPGSTIDGVGYEIVNDVPVAEFPERLKHLLKKPRQRTNIATSVEEDLPEAISIATHYLQRDAPPAIQGSNGDRTTFCVGCQLRDYGISEITANELMLEFYNARCAPPWRSGELQIKVGNAFSYGKNEAGCASPSKIFEGVYIVPYPCDSERHSTISTASAERPIILLEAGELPNTVSAVEDALIAARCGIYQRDGKIVGIGVAQMITAQERTVMTPQIVELGEYRLADLMMSTVDFQRWDGRSKIYKSCDAPAAVAKTLLARRGNLRLPVLAGLIDSPTLRANGSPLERPGYDDASGLFLDPGMARFPLVPDRPSRDEALTALGLIEAVIAEFPFVSGADKSVALAAILTATVRKSLPSAPAFAFSAPVAGSGKSKLVDIMNMIATGREAGVIAIGSDAKETEKRLAALLRGGSNVAFDNAEAPIGGDLLCQLLTQPIVRIRILGVSETPELQTNVMVTITGNNLRIAGDMTRRTLLCELDPKVEQPELRTFAFDPVLKAKEDRAQLLVAALTVLRAHHIADGPGVVTKFGSFETWAERVGGALTWLGKADPIKTVEKSRARDPRIDRLRAVMVQWREHIGNDKVRTNEAVRKAELISDFREAVREATGGANGTLNVGKLGTWLGSNEGRILDGASFKRNTLHGNTQWWLERHSS